MQFDFHKAHARQRPLGGLLNIIQTCPQKRDESGTGAVVVSRLLQCEILTIEEVEPYVPRRFLKAVNAYEISDVLSGLDTRCNWKASRNNDISQNFTSQADILGSLLCSIKGSHG